jgi:hypothetical protein
MLAAGLSQTAATPWSCREGAQSPRCKRISCRQVSEIKWRLFSIIYPQNRCSRLVGSAPHSCLRTKLLGTSYYEKLETCLLSFLRCLHSRQFCPNHCQALSLKLFLMNKGLSLYFNTVSVTPSLWTLFNFSWPIRIFLELLTYRTCLSICYLLMIFSDNDISTSFPNSIFVKLFMSKRDLRLLKYLLALKYIYSQEVNLLRWM